MLIDDKLRILAAVKKIWGERVTTVFPKQGHNAFDPNILTEYRLRTLSLLGSVIYLLAICLHSQRRSRHMRWLASHS